MPSKTGLVVYICPKCNKQMREYTTSVNGLNRWAFKDGYGGLMCVEFDGRGCCF